MKKILMGAAALLFAGVLAGCNQLTQYTLSEQEVNDYLQKHNDYQKQIGVPGLVDANIVLTQLQSQIGRSEPGKVTLSGDAKVNITSILGPQAADLKLTLKAQPVYDRAQGAIYLEGYGVDRLQRAAGKNADGDESADAIPEPVAEVLLRPKAGLCAES